MKLLGTTKFWMPLVGLGAALVLAPQSRAQADVSPDHFDENGITNDFAHAKPSVAKANPPKNTAAPGGNTVAHSRKPGTSAKAQAIAKNSPAAPKQQLVAVNDKSKLPPRKQNDPK